MFWTKRSPAHNPPATEWTTQPLPAGRRPGRREREPTHIALDLARRADRLGYDSFWVAEVTGTEAFSVLGAACQAAPALGLGTGVLPFQVRTPPLLAMAAASLQALARRDERVHHAAAPAHAAGDRAGALAAVPDEMVDAINVIGNQALVRDRIAEYRLAGVDVPVIFPLTWGTTGQDALETTLRAAIAPPTPAAHGI